MTNNKIPKIIHYCWFGGNPIPESNKKFMESWKKFCPNYEIIEWNESNYDVTQNRYMKEAYENRQWAFVSDYARLDIIYEHGGIYLDTDVELIKPLDDLLNLKGFIGFTENKKLCNTGLGFGAIPKLPIIKEIRDGYENLVFIREDGSFDQTPCTYFQTDILLKKGLKQDNSMQEIEGLTIFPDEYFCPRNWIGQTHITQNTYSIHHYEGSWHTLKQVGPLLFLRKNNLLKLNIILSPDEENLYYDILQKSNAIKTKKDLLIGMEFAQKIISVTQDSNNNEYNEAIILLLKLIAEKGLQNKVTSLKLYFTTFRKWKIFETPRANLRYIYHCLRNILHV